MWAWGSNVRHDPQIGWILLQENQLNQLSFCQPKYSFLMSREERKKALKILPFSFCISEIHVSEEKNRTTCTHTVMVIHTTLPFSMGVLTSFLSCQLCRTCISDSNSFRRRPTDASSTSRSVCRGSSSSTLTVSVGRRPSTVTQEQSF